eukprot:4004842-Amphidinium_carterae.1
MDRPDLSQAACSLARGMKQPLDHHLVELKRVGRYLRGNFHSRLRFERQQLPVTLTTYCDSDHAGDPVTRKSRSGMAIMLGTHCLKHSSAIQSTVSLSSGESEYYALLRAASHTL